MLDHHDFKTLMSVLKTHGQSKSKFSTKEWLSQIGSQVPSSVTKAPSEDVICRLRRDIEESEKPFLETWVKWKDGRYPTLENLAKTRMLVSEDAYKYSKKHGFSSRWTSDPAKKTNKMPWN